MLCRMYPHNGRKPMNIARMPVGDDGQGSGSFTHQHPADPAAFTPHKVESAEVFGRSKFNLVEHPFTFMPVDGRSIRTFANPESDTILIQHFKAPKLGLWPIYGRPLESPHHAVKLVGRIVGRSSGVVIGVGDVNFAILYILVQRRFEQSIAENGECPVHVRMDSGIEVTNGADKVVTADGPICRNFSLYLSSVTVHDSTLQSRPLAGRFKRPTLFKV